jgi:hypothetical protein
MHRMPQYRVSLGTVDTKQNDNLSKINLGHSVNLSGISFFNIEPLVQRIVDVALSPHQRWAAP